MSRLVGVDVRVLDDDFSVRRRFVLRFAAERLEVSAAIEENVEVTCVGDFDLLHSFDVAKHRSQLLGYLAGRTLCMFREVERHRKGDITQLRLWRRLHDDLRELNVESILHRRGQPVL